MSFTVPMLILSASLFAQQSVGGPPLPAPVKRAFDKAYPGATISAVTQERENNRTLFRVDCRHQGKRRIVLFDAGGAVIELAEPVEEKELPQPVVAAIRAHPRAIYVSGLKVTRGGSVEYRLTVRGSRRTAMVARPDGTVVTFE